MMRRPPSPKSCGPGLLDACADRPNVASELCDHASEVLRGRTLKRPIADDVQVEGGVEIGVGVGVEVKIEGELESESNLP